MLTRLHVCAPSLASAQPNTIEIDVPLIDTLNLPVATSHDLDLGDSR